MNDDNKIVTMSYSTDRPMFWHYLAGKGKRGMTIAAIKVNCSDGKSFIFFGCSVKSTQDMNFVKKTGREVAIFRAKMYPYKRIELENEDSFKTVFYDEIDRIRGLYIIENINREEIWREIDHQVDGLISKHEIWQNIVH